ncbi:DNA repair protein RecN [Desulfospira joergensenii]|uniref:DNA repair protein RecN n=1 Tax=Desulfospira joergensenii TaxID=53329 RepID=UPI0003B6ED4C|nr:DNA repair protein RecN [Desulfospira joergensenii]
MLSELAIKKFAIIEDIRISFRPGLSVLTGETGAGKSIIIEAVNLLLGARASSDLVRTGEEAAELTAIFDLEPDSPAAEIMEQQGMDRTEGLIIRRLISSSGKGRVFINSRPSTLDLLKQVTRNLAGVASQHAHQGLLKEENHLELLDEFAGTTGLRNEIETLYQAIMPLKSEIEDLKKELEEKIRERDLIQFQVDEIQAAAIEEDEDKTLESLKERLMNAARIFEAVNGTIHEIYDQEGSVIEKLSGLKAGIERFSQADPDLGSAAERLESAVFDLQDLTHTLRDYSSSIDLDPESLERVDQRLDLVSRLKRKYGGSLESLFERYEAMTRTLDQTRDLDRQIQALEKKQKDLELVIIGKAGKLSEQRQKAGGRLSELAAGELEALEMGRARFEPFFSTRKSDSPNDIVTPAGDKVFSSGLDRVSFMLSPNPGEDLKPLARIASGGELSRIVLALKAVLSKNQSLETLIFDEVDAGIGGATSEKVGLKLKELARRHQVICITHLAQIARFGNFQFRISKQVAKGRTTTSILPLETREERVEELARMIGGTHITDATLAHARELLV